jgi:hypothetical protein
MTLVDTRGLAQSVNRLPVTPGIQPLPGAASKIPMLAFTQEQFRNLYAQAILDQETNYTIVGGRFSPTLEIDLASQVVTLSVAGANDLRLVFSVGSFRKTGLGGYVARVIRGLSKTDILLQPFNCGDWAYSAGIEGFLPGSTSVTVSLTIGSQGGRATVEAYLF